MQYFQLYSRYEIPVSFLPEIPPCFDESILRRATTFFAEEENNAFIFQEMRERNFTARFHCLMIEEPAKFRIRSEARICLLLSTERTVNFDLEGHGNITLHGMHFNLLSVPSFNACFDAAPDTYFLFEISLSGQMLRSFSERRPAMKEFMAKADGGKPARLFDNNAVASQEMICLYNLIIEWGKNTEADAGWLEVYVTDFLELAFQRPAGPAGLTMDTDQLNRLYDVKDQLEDMLEHNLQVNLAGIESGISYGMMKKARKVAGVPENRWPVQDLSDYASLTPRQLNQSFKQLFGYTLAAFRLEFRWGAIILMLCSHCAIPKLARMTGLRSPQLFILAFTRRFHCTPQAYLDAMENKLKNNNEQSKPLA